MTGGLRAACCRDQRCFHIPASCSGSRRPRTAAGAQLRVLGRTFKRRTCLATLSTLAMQTNVPAPAPSTAAAAGEPPAKKKRSLEDLMGGEPPMPPASAGWLRTGPLRPASMALLAVLLRGTMAFCLDTLSVLAELCPSIHCRQRGWGDHHWLWQQRRPGAHGGAGAGAGRRGSQGGRGALGACLFAGCERGCRVWRHAGAEVRATLRGAARFARMIFLCLPMPHCAVACACHCSWTLGPHGVLLSCAADPNK